MEDYKPRLMDNILDFNLKVFGAVRIVGPKGCGKTTTSLQHAKTVIKFQDEDRRDYLLMVASTTPSLLLRGDKPILFDEWQDAPKLWGAIRDYVDTHPREKGNFILTGSSAKQIDPPHTGTMRIAKLNMLPMSLYESGDSSGDISLSGLVNDPSSFLPYESPLSLDEVIFLICRGGWPSILYLEGKKEQLSIASHLYKVTVEEDISAIDGKKRNPDYARAILSSYSRNVCQLAKTKAILDDATSSTGMGAVSFYDCLSALKRLYILDDIPAWSPSLRSKTNSRSTPKRNLVDPSLAVRALKTNEEGLKGDFKTLGFLFESLCMRDLKAYAEAGGGQLYYYRDRYGLEADGVILYEDGRCALVEVKLGQNRVEEGAKNLNKIEELIGKYNERNPSNPLRKPDLKLVVTTDGYAFKRDDGVFVVPIGCLRD